MQLSEEQARERERGRPAEHRDAWTAADAARRPREVGHQCGLN